MSIKKEVAIEFDKKEKVLNKLKKIFDVNDILIESFSYGWDSSVLYIGYNYLCLYFKSKLFDKKKSIEYGDIQDVLYLEKEKMIILKLINVKDVIKLNKLGNKSESIFYIIRKLFELQNPTYAELSTYVPREIQRESTTDEIFNVALKYKNQYFIKDIHINNILLSINDVGKNKIEKSFPLNHITSITICSRPQHLILREKNFEVEMFILNYSNFIEKLKNSIKNITIFYQNLASFWSFSMINEEHKSERYKERSQTKIYSPGVVILSNQNQNYFVSDLNDDENKKLEDSKNLYHQNLKRPKRVKVNKGVLKPTNKNELPPLPKYIVGKVESEKKKKKKENSIFLKVENVPLNIKLNDVESLFSSYAKIEKIIDHVENELIYTIYLKLKYESEGKKLIKELNNYNFNSENKQSKIKIQIYSEKIDENLIFKKYLTPWEFKVNLNDIYMDENKNKGFIRFIGLLAQSKRQYWVGLEWEIKGRGKHDGIAFNERKFKSPPNSAVFVQLDALSKKWKKCESSSNIIQSNNNLDITITNTSSNSLSKEIKKNDILEDVVVVVKQNDQLENVKPMEKKSSFSNLFKKSPRKEPLKKIETSSLNKQTNKSIQPSKPTTNVNTQINNAQSEDSSTIALSDVEFRESNIVDHVNLSRPKRKKRNKNIVTKSDLPNFD